jgi:ribosomal protein S18 acetylase RimI-like enzyme
VFATEGPLPRRTDLAKVAPNARIMDGLGVFLAIGRAESLDALAAGAIFERYFEAIGLPPALRDGPAEVASYLAPPKGLWLARERGRVVGAIALRPLAARPGACEIKRLYVEPDARGRGVAHRLLDVLEDAARAAGYAQAYLDTRADLTSALAFYERRGYRTCARYNDNPEATHFLRREL